MVEFRIGSWLDVSDSGENTPRDGASTPTRRGTVGKGKRPALDTHDLERANEKLRTRTDTPTTINSTTQLAPNDEMSRIPPIPLAKAMGLAFTLMGAAFLNVGLLMSIETIQLTRSRHYQYKQWLSPCHRSERT